MKEDKKAFIKNNYGSILITNTIIFFPLILIALILLLKIDIAKFYLFFQMRGNDFQIENTLITFIFISHLTVITSLLFYIRDLWGNVIHYKGEKKTYSRYHQAAFSVCLIVIFLLGVYLFDIFFCRIEVFIKSGFLIFSSDFIIKANKFITLFVFICFSLIDMIVIKSLRIEIDEVNKTDKPKTANDMIKKESKIKIKEYIIKYSYASSFLINIPIIILMSFIIWITKVLNTPGFFTIFDKDLLSYELLEPNNSQFFNFFFDGFETGIVVSSIILSQIIFAVIKTYWKYHYFHLNKKLNSLQKATSGDKSQELSQNVPEG